MNNIRGYRFATQIIPKRKGQARQGIERWNKTSLLNTVGKKGRRPCLLEDGSTWTRPVSQVALDLDLDLVYRLHQVNFHSERKMSVHPGPRIQFFTFKFNSLRFDVSSNFSNKLVYIKLTINKLENLSSHLSHLVYESCALVH